MVYLPIADLCCHMAKLTIYLGSTAITKLLKLNAKLISEDPDGASDLAEYLNSNDIVC